MNMWKNLLLLLGILMSVVFSGQQTLAASSVTITNYAEHLTPEENGDGIMEVSVEGEADEDGFLYIIKSIENMMPLGQVTGDNLSGVELEEYQIGSLSFYRIQAADPEKPLSITAKFLCPGFYNVKKKAADNGGESYPLTYSFTNVLPVDIEQYELEISVPPENEIIKVTKPSAYEDYRLREKEGLRSVGLSQQLSASSTTSLNFSYSVPVVSTMGGKVAVWVVCLGVGLTVLVVRIKEAREELQ